MSLRKTSCTACVSAKRRCDRGVPACHRCTKNLLLCEYPYPSMLPSNATTNNILQYDSIPSNPVSPGLWGFLNDTSITGSVNDVDVRNYSVADMAGLDLDSLSSPPTSFELPVMEYMADSEGNIWDGTLTSVFDASTSSRSMDVETGHSERSRRRRRHHLRGSQRTRQQHVQLVSNNSPALLAHEIWPRGRDVETWHFCAREFISFVGSFATTASSPFILQPSLQPSNNSHLGLHSSLQKALGVCGAYCTLNKARRDFFQQLLETEIQLLIESSKVRNTQANCYPPNSEINGGGFNQALVAFRQDLARLQTMTLYQIIGLFSTDTGRQRLAKEREALLASWTRELFLRIQVLTLRSKAISSPDSNSFTSSNHGNNDLDEAHDYNSKLNDTHHDSTSLSWYEVPLQQEEVISAYRTILTSYLVRSVFSVLAYQTCPLIEELASLPIYMPQQQQHGDLSTASQQGPWSEIRQNAEVRGLLNTESQTISYNDFADLWGEKNWNVGLEEYDRFTILLLVACKGVDITK